MRTCLLLALLSSLNVAAAFVAPSIITNVASSFALSAKVKKKKNKKSGGGGGAGGGFGAAKASASKKPRVIDDYSAFPALEPDVAKTLVPSTIADQVGDMPTEMYERLAGIYGFTAFNYLSADPQEEAETEEAEPMSFEDLLSSGQDEEPAAPSSDFSDLLKSSQSSSSSSMGGDMSDLLASATGGDASPVAAAPAPAVDLLPIDKLAPFDKFQVLHVDPLVLSVPNFLTDAECDDYIRVSLEPKNPSNQGTAPLQIRSKTVGKDSNAQSQRTSTTWFHHYEGVAALCAKTARLLGLDSIERLEEPQTVRYRNSEQFTWHLDALGDDKALAQAGQRVATLVIYLEDLDDTQGGATMFRDLNLSVQPQKGSALVFFPAAGGIPGKPLDIRTLHCGQAVKANEATGDEKDKWIAQLWVRESAYTVTAPPGNSHAAASDAIREYCQQNAENK